MNADAREPTKPDLWGDVFDFLATCVIILGWLLVFGWCIFIIFAGLPLLLGKTVKFTIHGPWWLPVVPLALPVLSIAGGRALRRRARTSVPARLGIAIVVAVYVAGFASRWFQ